ncbi:MAG: hypothetical protein K6L80_07610 [Agarilytica sp.]
MEETGPSIEDYIDILRRRKMLMIFTVPVLLFIAIAVTFTLPPIFRADGIILIQNQEIPEDLVKSTVKGLAEQQIEITRQRIMTSANIMNLIEKHNMYGDIRNKTSPFVLAENFRASMGVEMIEADVPGQWGQVSRANIAFIVSFMDKDPELAQRVANELTTMFLEENVKARVSKADDTAQFLKEEADRMQVRVQDIENKIAEFKIKYGDSLPELLQYNLAAVERLEGQIITNQDESVRLSDQIHTLNLELSNISPYVQYSSDTSGGAITPRQRLMELKQEYSRSIITYADSHPDIIRLKEEIRLAEESVNLTKEDVSDEDAVNPLYRQMRSRIKAAEKELKRMGERRTKMEADLADYNRRIIQTHQVKRNYDEMTRDYNSKLEKYQELRTKQLEANIAQNMEAENKAGSFKLIEPPTIPEKPVKPDRKKLLLLGVVLSFGVGGGLMLAAEFLDPGVRGVSSIAQILGQQPLAVIPHIFNEEDYVERRANIKKLLAIGLGFCVCGVLVFHFFVMGIDIMWMKIMAKISVI